MNKANCTTCDHKKYPDGGHCYMFKTEPKQTCGLHTGISMVDVTLTAKDVGSLMFNSSISDEEFKRTATALLTKMFSSI